jgi:phosphoribosyl 1,2-cyclic phosphodiesterase
MLPDTALIRRDPRTDYTPDRYLPPRNNVRWGSVAGPEVEYAPGNVGPAILSHLHQDHIGGLPELGGTEIIVSAAE